MWNASSAMRTWRAPRSASEYTATVAIPISRQARITRTAISPRFAMRTFLNTAYDHTQDVSILTPGRHPLAGLRHSWEQFRGLADGFGTPKRSEEHTSELQSQFH